MGKAIGGSLPLAVGIALSPLPIIAVVLMLTSRRAKANGPAFVLGWLLGLGIVGAVVLSLAGVIMSVLCLVIAAKLIGDAIGSLAG